MKHTHQMIFGRREAGCGRCAELDAGAPPRPSWTARRDRDEARQLAAIHAHDFAACAARRGVCTCFE